jgi:F-type H+-transporting ATPase subunit delta
VASENISVAGLAGRYATALFELADEAKALDSVAGDLARIRGLIEGSPDMARFVRSPVFSRDEQGRAIAAVLDRLGVSPLTRNFMGLLAQKRRLFAFLGIAAAFDTLVAARKGETAAAVVSAKPLSPAQRAALQAALKSSIKREIRMTESVDPSLLGGLIVKVGSRQIDSSLKSKLARLERAMKGA